MKPKFTYRRMVKREECPHLMTPEHRKRCEAIVKEFGESPFVKSAIRGEFIPAIKES